MDVLRIVRWMVRAEWPVRLLSPVIGRLNRMLAISRFSRYSSTVVTGG